MNKYVKFTLTFLGIWFAASLLNGLLSGIVLAVFDGSSYGSNPLGTLALAILFSFLLSVPMVGLVWFVGIVVKVKGKTGDDLFQFVLGTGFICGIAAAVFFVHTIGAEFKNVKYIAGLCIIISAMASLLFFRRQIKVCE